YAAVTGLNIANGLPVAICNPATTTCTSDFTIQADVSAVHIVADVLGYFRNPTPPLALCTICFTCGGSWPSFQGAFHTVNTGMLTQERGSNCSGGFTATDDSNPFLCCR